MEMIITKTPLRMSFFGGGTDMELFFRKHGGAVLSTTIDKYCYVLARQLPGFYAYSTEICCAGSVERVNDRSLIRHTAVRCAMEMLDVRNIRLFSDTDLPRGSGMGTSSSFAVGMLNAFHALKGEEAGARQLAEEAIRLERVLCSEAGGWQDQIAAAFGGMNRINFRPDGTYEVLPLAIAPDRKRQLNDNLMLFFTGITRSSPDLQKVNAEGYKEETEHLMEIAALVDEAERVLTDDTEDLDEFGRLLDRAWYLKKAAGRAVTTAGIDELYNEGMRAGALGGKLLGAGGGGFLVFYVRPEQQDAVKEAMKKLVYVPFRFEERGTRFLQGGAGA